jgi:uncharacterized membrane protein YhhN
MKYAVLGILAVFTTIHLIDSWKDDAKKRRRTKPFLLILVLIYYLLATDSPSIMLIIALSLSWIGDVLIMTKGNKWFISGGTMFLFSHIFFAAACLLNIVKVDFNPKFLILIIPVSCVYIAISILTSRSIKANLSKKMFVLMLLYLFFNTFTNICALVQLLILKSPGALVTYIGAVLFFVSDCSLYLVRYHKNENIIFKRHFTVMLTYVLGELLIAQGFLLLG